MISVWFHIAFTMGGGFMLLTKGVRGALSESAPLSTPH